MTTFKQRLNLILRRSWNKRDFDYKLNFKKAVKFTKEMNLSLPEIPEFKQAKLTTLYKQFLINDILTEIYGNNKLKIEDVALKCFWVSRQLQYYLKKEYDLDSIITSGTVYGKKRLIYHESKSEIKRRLSDSTYCDPAKFHTWLTLETYEVIDLVLPASMWLEFGRINEGSEEEAKKVAWFDPENSDTNGLFYKPVFIGYDYFKIADIRPKLHFIIK